MVLYKFRMTGGAMVKPRITAEDRERRLTSASEAYVRGDLSADGLHEAENSYMTDYWSVTWEFSPKILSNNILRLLRGPRRQGSS